jgi:hypothetical protein
MPASRSSEWSGSEGRSKLPVELIANGEVLLDVMPNVMSVFSGSTLYRVPPL